MAKIRPIYNIAKLIVWPMINEDNETYGDPMDLTDRLMTYDDSVGTSTQKFYGDGKVVQIDVDEDSGTLVLGIGGLHGEEFAKFFDAQVNSISTCGSTFKVVNETGEEYPPYFCVALMAQKGKNLFNLRKWPKVRFQKMAESAQQKTGTRTYSTPTMTGEFIRCERLGIKRSRLTDVDTSTLAGQTILSNWFGSPDWFGGSISGNTLTNLSVFKREGLIEIAGGETVLVGDVIKVTNSAYGGTAPYTYVNKYTAPGESTAVAIPAAGLEIEAAGTYELESTVTDAAEHGAVKIIQITAVSTT